MSRTVIPLVAFAVLSVACDRPEPTTPLLDGILVVTPQAAVGGVAHHASLGSADVCEALGLPTGCDANFSLVANEYADGSVSGQWHDQFAEGSGIHVAVDCLAVSGNQAVIGGVITNATGFVDGFEGTRAVTSVQDNGTSSNDAADRLSFSFFPAEANCADIDPGAFPLFDLLNGQVKVR